MGSFRMKVGNAEIVALSDMNVTHPIPLEKMWPKVPLQAWQAFKERSQRIEDRRDGGFIGFCPVS